MGKKHWNNLNENEIAFLDTIIYRGKDNQILTRLYHKPQITSNTYILTLHIPGDRKEAFLMDYL